MSVRLSAGEAEDRPFSFNFAWMKASIGEAAPGTLGGWTRASGVKLQNLRPSLMSITRPCFATTGAVRGSGAPIFIQSSNVLTSVAESWRFGGICKS